MEPVRSGCFCAFILFLAVRLRAADCAKVIVGDPFKIPISCEPGRLLRDLGDDGTREIATGQSGQWKVSREEDRDRIKIDSSNIVFTHTLYTDGGIYELTCSTSGTKETIQLEVVVASEKSVTQGDKVTLPCYFKTIRGTGLPGWWERNGNETPADRLTVSTDWITTGDLSLTIDGAQPEDSGDYFCYTQDGKRSGNPAAVRLTVTEKKSHQIISSTAAPGNIFTWVLAAILLVLIVALLYLWCCKLRNDRVKL
uniref:Ig-like domain-containing protein n=1 Tax=Poecilia mexicana TaxID=48701 RepID=A0A3B3XJ98_9TELE